MRRQWSTLTITREGWQTNNGRWSMRYRRQGETMARYTNHYTKGILKKVSDINPCQQTRPKGFEPLTYGLEIRAVGFVSICE